LATHPTEMVNLLSTKGADGWSLVLQGQAARAVEAKLVAAGEFNLHGGIEADAALGASHGAARAPFAQAAFATCPARFRVLGFVVVFKLLRLDNSVRRVGHAVHQGGRVVQRPQPATAKGCELGESALAVHSDERSPRRWNHVQSVVVMF